MSNPGSTQAAAGSLPVPRAFLGRAASDRPPVAVIGAGFSGTMVAIHLASWLPPDQPILLCERGDFGRGAAYTTPNASHWLNVRAANMSAFPRQADHFETWLRTAAVGAGEVQDTDAGRFASRGLYGRYLNSLLTAAVAGSPTRLRLVRGEVTDIVRDGAGYRLVAEDGESVPVAGVVLAMGNVPAACDGHGVYRANPWAPGVLSDLRPAEPVVILGTGLTMVDLALELHSSGFSGPVIALSRRGLLPHWHRATQRWPMPGFSAAERGSVNRLFARVREEVRQAEALGVDWRGVVDSLRPITADLWRGLPLEERRRFLRHLRPYWDIHRHRLAGPVSDRLASMMASNFLTVRTGRIVSMDCRPGQVELRFRPRGQAQVETLVAQRVINATGLQNAAGADSRLIGNLRRRELIRFDPLDMGLDVTDSLQVVGTDGEVLPNMWALGPLVRGMFWECVAVPDIRTQAERVARQVWTFLEKRARHLKPI